MLYLLKFRIYNNRGYILIMLLFGFSNVMGQQTFLDNFNTTSYSNNNGTSSFSSNWNEGNDDNSPSGGGIRIANNVLQFQKIDNELIERSLNLSGALNATLTFNYNGADRGGQTLLVQLWNGSLWQTVSTLNNNNSGSISYPLTANQMSSSSAIRFVSGSGKWGKNDIYYIDNVQFSASYGPTLSINDVTVNEGSGSAIFTVTHTDGNATGAFTVNYTTVNGSALAGSDYIAKTGTLNFSGISGVTNTISISIIDDSEYESSETFTIQFTSVSNPSVNISDVGIGTITDNEVILNNTPLTLFDDFAGYIGYTSTGGTLRTQDNNTNACSVTNSSSNTLTSSIPVSGLVDRAYLYWSHSGALPDTQVTFEGNTVNADYVYTSSLTGGRIFYGGVSDVTSIIKGITNPSTNVYDFSGLTIDTSNTYCSSATVLGGWSLLVFYSDPSLPASTINLYQGFHGESNSSSSYTLGGFFAIGATGSKTTVLSWEGDQTLSNNELLSVTSGAGTFTLSGDGDNNGITVNNPFNSTIYDNTATPVVNNALAYGVDLDTYDVSPYVTAGESTISTTVQSGQDFIILNAVVLKVPSNLITGTVFEDINYGGGAGRNLINSNGIPLGGAKVELYNSTGTLLQTYTTNSSGKYVFGGMANGTYTVRVVNGTVKSTRIGGSACTTCLPTQTFKVDYALGALTENPNKVGGENPSGVDPASGIRTGAQSISSVTIFSQGVVGVDFGYNFNTIVNTNQIGQGSLNQFITNANNLDETGLDIEANSIFDPAAGEDTSIFMIPPTGDALGRAASTTYGSGYFDIFITDAQQLPIMTAANTIVDGRTQTAYSGNTNAGTLGAGGTSVGVNGSALFNFNRPEIQVHRNGGDVFRTQGNNITIRNLAIYSNDKAGILVNAGLTNVFDNILGVNALGVKSGAIQYATEVIGGTAIIARNFFNGSDIAAIRINGGSNTILEYNHIFQNGTGTTCMDNILLDSGSGIIIRYNLINDAAGIGIEGVNYSGGLVITENTITGNGISSVACSSGIFDDAGIRLKAANVEVSKNIIHGNRGEGVVVAENVTGIWITQNSMYNNGLRAPSLGIDLDNSKKTGDGVSLNDNGDGDSGPNNLNNFPIFKTISTNGANLIVQGWARPGAIIELFISDVSSGTALPGANQLGYSADYGEGQTYLATVIEGTVGDLDTGVSNYSDVDGSTDTTNNFKFSIPLPIGAMVGQKITATATIANSTSEFSPVSIIKVSSIITNRRITYRVNKS
ncbi:right-handed parallel beta-helix repeat-containing protein [Flavobacteriaceae bacterium KMM 6897]|nr:right-handed parallel beta-helix repeat-containing protein [Flavobacteriaceae bacterium KMM 6897]MEB8347253.1 right-handed parallel beta-helix repeat-containing protein [Flavobacteriaceae bacterium KMM 6898]